MAVGALLLVGSAAAGIWAYDQSVADGLRGWKRTHFPSPAAWTHALAELRYRPVADGVALSRALRTLPAQLDADGAIWATPDFGWIAVFGSPDHHVSAQAYCLDCAQAPRTWAPQGMGWDGFDSALERARIASAKYRVPARKHVEEPRDPREIRY